ncbi:SpoIID/LytB domain protein [Friedmanniella endophytica]|uniref:SpoIID/LytB domain protein n=1 Tax=Microlunatus kandeliicorticis TaxID=1759536 RepID=A0A7W3IUZ4_9ACTN|nr:SpoIID/LytB domain-containing protein [Microlunatus kandeliicorticis]MBA8795746.1 SpoIID/LytB domain protein [Microlunatus kandeliicorticis]
MAPHLTAARTEAPRTALRRGRRVLPGPAALLLTTVLATSLAGAAASTLPAAADTKAPSGTGTSAKKAATPTAFTLRGQGFGHGHGMSQWGAYGAATQGLTADQILAFYYPGTTPALQKKNASIRVWITADDDNVLRLVPTPGLTVRDASGHSYLLPAGAGYRSWRISRSGAGYKLTYLNPAGAWKTQGGTGLTTTTWTARNDAGIVKTILPGGITAEYRGTLSLVKRGTGGRTVNTVSMENYVRGVVGSEMPTSWPIEAVKAQAVAARTFAAKSATYVARSSSYDVCDTTWCQVYEPYAESRRGQRWVNETARGNLAVSGTAREVLTYDGSLALTQFSASNGGWTTAGNLPYLVAKADPYDQLIIRNAWSRTVSAATLQRLWPSAGTVTGLKVVKRDGHGRWGGRPTRIQIIGSKRTVTVSGSSFAATFGFRSTLFTVTS